MKLQHPLRRSVSRKIGPLQHFFSLLLALFALSFAWQAAPSRAQTAPIAPVTDHMVEARCRLRDLPALFPGLERRRHRRPERHHARACDYLQDLGVDAIWIAPMYPSPQVDFGYDISNYEAVDPQYGTLADMDRLIAEGRKHNIRVYCWTWC